MRRLSVPKPTNSMKTKKKILLALVFTPFLGLLLLAAWLQSQTMLRTSPHRHRITYLVNGGAFDGVVNGASPHYATLTYQNESGGTEQKTVKLPWALEWRIESPHFLYLSAQKTGESGIVHVAVYCDGQLLQEAESTSEYGIATASGRVP